jgi:hypothetical protein
MILFNVNRHAKAGGQGGGIVRAGLGTQSVGRGRWTVGGAYKMSERMDVLPEPDAPMRRTCVISSGNPIFFMVYTYVPFSSCLLSNKVSSQRSQVKLARSAVLRRLEAESAVIWTLSNTSCLMFPFGIVGLVAFKWKPQLR